MDLGFFNVDREVQKNTLAALDVFRSLGADVEEVDLGWTSEVMDAGMTYLNHLFGASLSRLLKKHGKDMTTYARHFAKLGQKSKAADFVGTLDVANRMYATLGPTLEKYNVLVCPTTALPAVPADFDQSKDKIRINGKPVSNVSLGWVMTTPFNTMSRCPVVSMPSVDHGPVWNGATGFVHESACAFLADRLADVEWYCAGPPPMIEALQRELVLVHGVPVGQIHFDRFF
jgi:amidase